MDLDLRKLRYFLATAEELNYNRAAERLRIAQPALSRQITALERELGVTLFERSKRGTVLTQAGRELVPEARALLGQAAMFQRRARVAGRGHRHFAIGFMPGIPVAGLVGRLRTRFPEVSVDVVRTGWHNQVEVLLEGHVDVSLLRLPVDTSGLTVVPLFEEPRLAVLASKDALCSVPALTLAHLAERDLLQPPDSHLEWRDAAAAARPHALTTAREDLPVVNTVEEKLEQVADGRGIIILPESTAMFYNRADVTYRYVEGLAPVQSAIAFEKRRASPILDAAVEIAREVYGAPDPRDPGGLVSSGTDAQRSSTATLDFGSPASSGAAVAPASTGADTAGVVGTSRRPEAQRRC